MLKNKKERKEYLENNDNWNLILERMDLGLRILKLKVTNMYRIEKMVSNSYIGDHWCSLGYTKYSFIEDGIQKDINNEEALKILMKL